MKKIKELLGFAMTPFEKFHIATKLRRFTKENGLADALDSQKAINLKEYPRLDKIVLSDPSPAKGSLRGTLMKRSSVNTYSSQQVSIEKLSDLFFYSAGLKKYNKSSLIKANTYQDGKRFYPSAGARFPLEVYFISLNTDLPMGLYHYNLRLNSLEVLLEFKKFPLKEYFRQKWIAMGGGVILITASFKRITARYQNRGYRHALVEAGHLSQNFLLNATSLGLASCPVGGYLDDNLNELLDTEPLEESVIYTIVIGEK